MVKMISSTDSRIRPELAKKMARGRYPTIFFEVGEFDKESLADFIDDYKRKSSQPAGVLTFETIEENQVFAMEYDPQIITEQSVVEFAQSLGL